MRINDYVRTNRGYIGKCVEPFNKKNSYDLMIDYRADITNIVKVSLNLIDLVSIGDYVNEQKVIDLYSPEGTYVLWIKLANGCIIHNTNDIHEIITSELASQVRYIVKRDGNNA